jgi:hypothetical protein
MTSCAHDIVMITQTISHGGVTVRPSLFYRRHTKEARAFLCQRRNTCPFMDMSPFIPLHQSKSLPLLI